MKSINACGKSANVTLSVFISNCARIALVDSEDNTPVVYPNPSAGSGNISFTTLLPEACKISITDLSGKVVFENRVASNSGTNKTLVNREFLFKETYLVQVSSTTINYNQKIVLQ